MNLMGQYHYRKTLFLSDFQDFGPTWFILLEQVKRDQYETLAFQLAGVKSVSFLN